MPTPSRITTRPALQICSRATRQPEAACKFARHPDATWAHEQQVLHPRLLQGRDSQGGQGAHHAMRPLVPALYELPDSDHRSGV
jgi:hypothetical protein